jgi:hypothetical protein
MSQADEQLKSTDVESEIEKLLDGGAEVPLEDENAEEQEETDEESLEETEQEEENTESDPESWKSQEFEVNGEKLSGAELASGYMKDADYRRKTAEAAQLRRDAEQKIAFVEEKLSTKANQLDVLANALYQEIVGDQSQLNTLIESDPAEYLRRSHYLANRNQLLQQAMAEREAVSKLQAQTQQKQLAEYVQAESARLVEALPEWKDKKTAEAEQREVAEYLISQGYDPSELSELYDHRALVLARKAWLYDKRANLKPSVSKPGVVVKPGAPQAQQTQNTKAKEQLKARAIKSGRTDDFAAAISQYL